MMKRIDKVIKSLLQVGLLSLGFCSANAAKLDLSDSPLVVSYSVESNIYFLLDDSASMDWELMVDDSINDFTIMRGLPFVTNTSADSVQRRYIHPAFHDSSLLVLPTIEITSEVWILRNHNGNSLYYNPTTDYEPWSGVDDDGNDLYSNAIATAAREYPYKDAASVVDLTIDYDYEGTGIFVAVYYKWIDDDNDGVIELTDSFTEVEIKPTTNVALFENGRTYAQEIQNFANWFQYYRKREYVQKAGIGAVVNNANAVRMGLGLINGNTNINKGALKNLNTNNVTNDPIKEGAPSVFSMTDPSNKTKLLKNIYTFTSSEERTPLRAALHRTGQMFSGKYKFNASPILSGISGEFGGECQQNFQVLMTDSFWNGPNPHDVSELSDITIGNADGDVNSTFYDKNHEDSYSQTLADVAMYYYENDLSSLDNDVPKTAGVDEADHQHLVTYTIGFGVKGNLDNKTLNPDAGEVTWPQPVADEISTIDDLWHAAYNGRGEYLNATVTDELVNALDQVVSDIADRSASASSVAINSAKLTTETVIYLAKFNTFRWHGEINAFKLKNIDTGELNDEPEWKAADVLSSRNLNLNPRAIITYNGSDGTPFQWDDISSDQQADLRINSAGGIDSDADAEARLDFIRGDRSNEGTGLFFRQRTSLLGDVVNSGPVFVGSPDLAWPDVAPFPTSDIYSDFQNDNAKRDGIVYVGANDGMLHAFSDETGKEVFAYIPNILYSSDVSAGMHYLTSGRYVHNFYNDLTPTISDVYINRRAGSGSGSDAWNTVLIGGLRGGGRGLFALNITDPDDFTEAKASELVMWEFSNEDDNDLGLTYSRPQVALANNGQWVAIFGNGYNSEGSGESALFIVDIEAGINGWQEGDYKKIKTGSGSTGNVNGLSTPALADIDGDGDIDRVYAGDLNGNLWVFDLSSSDSASWALADVQPLITTFTGTAITAKPALSFHPTVNTQESNSPNIMVFFGSGQYLQKSDITNPFKQRFYGIWDSGDYDIQSNVLVQQYVDTTFSSDIRVMTNNDVNYAVKKGWYMELDAFAERSVTSAVVRFDSVFFNTFLPSSEPCESGGSGFKMAVSAETGGALQFPEFDTNQDGIVDENDVATGSSGTGIVSGIQQDGYLPAPIFIGDLSFTAEKAIKVSTEPTIKPGRLSWQELLQ